MRKSIFVPLLLIWSCLFLGGCSLLKPAPEVRIEHIVVAPSDNLLVECDITPPPAKSDYLGMVKADAPFAFHSPGMPHSEGLPYDNISYVAQYVQAVAKKAEERERLQTNLNLKNYQNLDACNKRWAKLREWKTNALSTLSNQKKE